MNLQSLIPFSVEKQKLSGLNKLPPGIKTWANQRAPRVATRVTHAREEGVVRTRVAVSRWI